MDDEGRRLVEENLRLVPYAIARRFGSAAASNEDVISMGYVGLCQAAATFDPRKDTKFATYAYRCIINRIHAYSRHKFSKAGGCGARECTTLNVPMPSDGDEIEEFIDLIADTSVDVEREAMADIIMDIVRPHVPTWIALERSGMTAADFSKTQRVSKQRIHQRMEKEVRHARAALIDAGYTEMPA